MSPIASDRVMIVCSVRSASCASIRRPPERRCTKLSQQAVSHRLPEGPPKPREPLEESLCAILDPAQHPPVHYERAWFHREHSDLPGERA